MEEGIYYNEGWLERSALIDSLLAKMEFHANNISALCAKIVGVREERLLAKEQDWGLDPEMSTEII